MGPSISADFSCLSKGMTLSDLLVDSPFILAPYSGPGLPCFVFPQQLVYQSLLLLSGEILLPCWDGIQLHHLGLQLLNVFFYAPEISSKLEGHSNWSLQQASLSGLQQNMDGSGCSSTCKQGNMYPCTWTHLHGNALLLPHPLLPKQNQILWETHTYTCIIVQTVVRAFLASDLNSSCQSRRKLFIDPAHFCSSADAVLVCSGERRHSRLTG